MQFTKSLCFFISLFFFSHSCFSLPSLPTYSAVKSIGKTTYNSRGSDFQTLLNKPGTGSTNLNSLTMGSTSGGYITEGGIVVGGTMERVLFSANVSPNSLAVAALSILPKLSTYGLVLTAGMALYDYFNLNGYTPDGNGGLTKESWGSTCSFYTNCVIGSGCQSNLTAIGGNGYIVGIPGNAQVAQVFDCRGVAKIAKKVPTPEALAAMSSNTAAVTTIGAAVISQIHSIDPSFDPIATPVNPTAPVTDLPAPSYDPASNPPAWDMTMPNHTTTSVPVQSISSQGTPQTSTTSTTLTQTGPTTIDATTTTVTNITNTNNTTTTVTTVNSPDVPPPPDPPPIAPATTDDTTPYFNFLSMANPFSFDPHSYLPVLPTTTCTYEIHRTFHVPFLGTKNFDFAPCIPLQPLRSVLAWVFSVLTAWSCFNVIFRSYF